MFKYLALVAAAAALRLADDTKKNATLADEKNKTSLGACVDGKDANGKACTASLGDKKNANATESLGDARNATAAAL